MNEFNLLACFCLLLVAGVASKSKFVTVNLDAKWKSTPIMLEARSASLFLRKCAAQHDGREEIRMLVTSSPPSVGHLCANACHGQASRSSIDIWYLVSSNVMNCNTNFILAFSFIGCFCATVDFLLGFSARLTRDRDKWLQPFSWYFTLA